MLKALIRKVRKVAGDPVLRAWLTGRALGRFPGPPRFTTHRPPYLTGKLPLPAEHPDPPAPFRTLGDGVPRDPLTLALAGEVVTILSGEEDALFERAFADTESLLAFHRFAWISEMGSGTDPRWVGALWRAWRKLHGEPGGGWPWHPYTAAERVINILAFARVHGLPGEAGDTLAVLAAHGPAIAGGLEYFGEHHTSNHLANNGRGLYRLGLELGLSHCAQVGSEILINEAARIFLSSGVLREGSSHYHLLVAGWYADAAAWARQYKRPEAQTLADIANAALAVVPRLVLPAGLPLIGDISPDCTPLSTLQKIAGILPVEACNLDVLAQDGWLRADIGDWSGLWHVAPDGWSPMPGHGHQDCGTFELHCRGEALFIDPGRGAYGDDGDAAYYRAAGVHNLLLIDGADPFPFNKPYYDATFRLAIGGPPPVLVREGNTVLHAHSGFARLKEIKHLNRRWEFEGGAFTLLDHVSGAGRHTLTRRLVTPMAAGIDDSGVTLTGGKGRYHLHADGPCELHPLTAWNAYGAGRPATMIEITLEADLPFEGRIRVETA